MNTAYIHELLFAWWKREGRVLPWREKLSKKDAKATKVTQDIAVVRERAFTSYFATLTQRDPYRVVVAELMLQQTQVDRVLPKYEAWLKKWPTLADLAKATLADVLIFWQGLGYNRRARFLWLLAAEITERRHGVWPQT
jgi:adenine-specific DNA glycosylase